MTDLPALPQLRPYQERGYREMQLAAQRLRQERGAGAGCGILAVAPCGAGKTLLALTVARGAIARGNRVLWLAPRCELVTQPVAKLAEYGWTDVRVLQAGRDEGHPGAAITVASIQTLVARGLTPPADVVVYDEARHYVAAEWGRIAGAYASAVRIGLDATPARSDGAALGDLFDALVPISTIGELTDLGFLVPSVLYGPDEYRKELADTPLAAYQRFAAGRRCLVFCASRAQAERDAAAFRAAGIPAEAVDATTPAAARKAALDRVRSGETLVLCNVLLFTEGLDLVELEAIIIARGVAHESTWIQIGGRGLRPSPHTGKSRCVILDLRGHVHRHGSLYEERTWHLEGQPIRRVSPLPSVSQCRACLAWGPGGRPCAACGAAVPPPKPPKVSKRELKELQRERIPRVGREWDAWVQLVETALERGYKPQWAALRFRQRFGWFPRWSFEQVRRERAA